MSHHSYPDCPVCEHNRRLEKAAPDLLEALYCILNIEGAAIAGAINCKAYHGLDVGYHFDKVRAAVARAKGKES